MTWTRRKFFYHLKKKLNADLDNQIDILGQRLPDRGAQIIESSIFLIGQLSEEAQKARNKDVRNYREHQKFSRQKMLKDVFLQLLACSDLLISSLQKTT